MSVLNDVVIIGVFIDHKGFYVQERFMLAILIVLLYNDCYIHHLYDTFVFTRMFNLYV